MRQNLGVVERMEELLCKDRNAELEDAFDMRGRNMMDRDERGMVNMRRYGEVMGISPLIKLLD